ncbi:hypothetical protein ACQY0O_008125 [Thecaphora frezii]
MSTNAYMEPSNYASHHAGFPDRGAPLFQADAHEPRAPRPFDAQTSSDPYAAAASGAPGHASAGPLDEPHSPLSSYRGSFSHHPQMGMPHHRQDSISSISSPHDVNGSWAPSSPGLAPSRHASIYSLNGQFDQVGLTSGSIDGSSGSSHMYETSPPLPAQVRYAQAQAADSRRFSLDERSIRPQPGMGKPGMISAEYQTPGSGRQWPWGASQSGGTHGRHASVSAAPPPQSYDYSRMSYSGVVPSNVPPSPYGYDSMSTMSPTRYRSMSSSAASGRPYGASYGVPGSAAHAAAIGYGMAPHLGSGMMMEGDIPGGPGPARRAKFKRSRTGCLVCRKRKVKCSQDGTPCKQCRIGKRDCHYDENPQKRKTKKDKVSLSTTASSEVTTDSKLSAPNSATSAHGPDVSSASQLPSQDSGYYATAPNVDHRGSVDTSLGNANGHPHSGNGVSFSMPFPSHPSSAGSTTHSSSNGSGSGSGSGVSDGPWSNPSPFGPGIGAGPHGEAHPVSHASDYGWGSKHDNGHGPVHGGYSGSGSANRNGSDAYWSQHPTAYGPRSADLEHAES